MERTEDAAFGPADRPGRLAISVRDLARFGLLYLRGGRWKDRQVLTPESVRAVLSSPVPAGLPRTRGREADMLPKQRSLGGGKDQTPAGPGCYSFNWWLNRTDQEAEEILKHARAMAANRRNFKKMTEHDVALHHAIATASHNVLFAQVVSSF